MAADRTLVDAAFKEATSRAGVDIPNLKPLYDSNTKNMKTYTGIVTGAIDAFKKDEEALKIGKDGQLKRFKNVVRKGYESLAAGETMPQKVLNALDEKIRGLQSEFEAVNTYGKGDNAENERARINVNARLQKVINQAVKNREFFTNLGLSIENWNHGEIDEDVIAPQQKMMDLANVDGDVDTEIYFNENDKLVYSTKNYYSDANSSWGDEVSYTLEQMAENIGQKDLSADTEIVRQNKLSQQKGDADGKNPDKEYSFNVKLEKGEFLNTIKSDEDFKNIARRPIDGLTDLSFRDGLIDNLEISFDILDNMFYDDNGVRMDMGQAFKDLDLNGDDKITKDDFTTSALEDAPLADIFNTKTEGKSTEAARQEALEMFKINKREFLDALTDIKHPAFNLDRSKSLIGDYYTGIKEQNYKLFFKEQRTKLPLKEGEAWEGSYKSLYTGYGNRALNYDVGIEMLGSLRKAKEGEATYFGLYGKTYSYDPKRKRWYGDGPDLIREGGGVTTTEIIKATGIVASEFKALMGGDLPPIIKGTRRGENKEGTETPNVADFGRNANVENVLAGWEKRYKGMGFTYSRNKPGINQKYTRITIKAQNGNIHVTDLGRVLGKGKKQQAEEFNKFIEENKI
jgi:hypothetical protein